MYVVTGLGITVGFHRHFTHRAFATSKPVRATLAVMGTMAIEGPITAWVADHRKHHAFSDQQGDPHSPHVDHGRGLRGALRGLLHAHVGWLFVHTQRANKQRYAPDLIADRTIAFVDRTTLWWIGLGLALPFGLGYALGGTLQRGADGPAVGRRDADPAAAPRDLLDQLAVSLLRPPAASRPATTRATSRWLAPLTFGEAWHNNHHAFPTSAVHGLRWYRARAGSERDHDRRAAAPGARVGRRDDQPRAPGGEAGERAELSDGAGTSPSAGAAELSRGPAVAVLDGLRGVAALGIVAYHCWLLSGEAGLGDEPCATCSRAASSRSRCSSCSAASCCSCRSRARDGDFGSGAALRPAPGGARSLPAYYVVLARVRARLPAADHGERLADQVSPGLRCWPTDAGPARGAAAARLPRERSGFGVDPVVWTLSLEASSTAAAARGGLASGATRGSGVAIPLALGLAVRLAARRRARTRARARCCCPPSRCTRPSSPPGCWRARCCTSAGASARSARRRPACGDRRRGRRAAAAADRAPRCSRRRCGGPDGSDVRDAVQRDAFAMALLPLACAAAMLGLAARAAPRCRPRWRARRGVRWLGSVSYGTFLVHFPVHPARVHDARLLARRLPRRLPRAGRVRRAGVAAARLAVVGGDRAPCAPARPARHARCGPPRRRSPHQQRT